MPKATTPAAARAVGIEVEAEPLKSMLLPAVGAKADGPALEPPKPRSRTSTSYVPWSELMKRTLGINVLQCPACQATMLLLAVITRREVIDRILTHVKLAREPIATDPALYYDMTGEPVPSWAVGLDPDPDERGPPTDWDLVDPPAPEM